MRTGRARCKSILCVSERMLRRASHDLPSKPRGPYTSFHPDLHQPKFQGRTRLPSKSKTHRRRGRVRRHGRGGPAASASVDHGFQAGVHGAAHHHSGLRSHRTDLRSVPAAPSAGWMRGNEDTLDSGFRGIPRDDRRACRGTGRGRRRDERHRRAPLDVRTAVKRVEASDHDDALELIGKLNRKESANPDVLNMLGPAHRGKRDTHNGQPRVRHEPAQGTSRLV